VAANQYDDEIKELQTDLRRLADDASGDTRAAMQNHIDSLTQAKADTLSAIPASWESARTDFTELQQQERKLRNQYRKAADKGYSPIAKLQATLAGTEALQALDGKIAELLEFIRTTPPADTLDTLSAASRQFGAVEGASKIKSAISKARKALKAKKPSLEKAEKALADAQQEYDTQMQWRMEAAEKLASPVADYERSIRSTIGIRQQSKLTKPQALYIAACDADHRDISLNF